jgi:hypothetical protein
MSMFSLVNIPSLAHFFLGRSLHSSKLDSVRLYLKYLLRQEFPSDEIIARQIVCRVKAYTIINGLFYKQHIWSLPMLCFT